MSGKRYNRETQEVRYKGKSILIYLTTIEQSVDFLNTPPFIANKNAQRGRLRIHNIGSQSTTLSGGEAQRVKPQNYLNEVQVIHFTFLTNLQRLAFEDVKVLLDVLTYWLIKEYGAN